MISFCLILWWFLIVIDTALMAVTRSDRH